MATRTLKLTIAYDGTDYAGWQVQAGQPSLQAEFQKTLQQIVGQRTHVAASGRTDAGVHALGQVVSFETDSDLSVETFQRALNAHLPRDIVVIAAEEAPPGFHARRDAVRKRYRYILQDSRVRDVCRLRYAHHLYKRLDVAAMQQAAAILVGMHDFASFESAGSRRTTTVRTINELTVRRGDSRENEFAAEQGGRTKYPNLADIVVIEVEADGFLYNMVRNIVGTLIEVGQGRAGEEWVANVLAARDRRQAGQTAPPQGLFLVQVDY
ncbi:MAG: tRNA pseudouridine(38-40) synthase TruA [Pirellulales bacterium]|nr:tRNA pseudouridine(38-40) synthase TruA [Pirellulales bacterium]